VLMIASHNKHVPFYVTYNKAHYCQIRDNFNRHSRCPENVLKKRFTSPTLKRRHIRDIRTFECVLVRDRNTIQFSDPFLPLFIFQFFSKAQESLQILFYCFQKDLAKKIHVSLVI
jgi:hypothetical protein